MISDGIKGKVGEYAFATEASSRGLLIGFPAIEAIPYDFFLHTSKGILRIQVKSAHTTTEKYSFSLRKKDSTCYTKQDCDYVALWLKDRDAFYIIPVEDLAIRSLDLYPDKGDSKYEQYREAWHLLGEPIKDGE